MGGVVDDGTRAVVLVVRDDVEVVLLRIPPEARPDLGIIEALARLALAARRFGWTIRLQNPCADLCCLLDLTGLAEVLGLDQGVSDTSSVGSPNSGNSSG